MNAIPFIPDNAPFTPEQRQWLNGYLAGLFSNAAGALAAAQGFPAGPAAPAIPLTVLYGSQTGTSEGLAKKIAKEAEKRGFHPTAVCMDKYETVDFATAENILIVTSTYGDGEPPDNAQAFWSFLSGEAAPQLGHARYSVLALGDTNYPAFCQFGKNCDERLAQLGAKPVHPRADCDVEYEEPAKAWMDAVLTALNSGGAPAALPAPVEAVAAAAGEEKEAGYSRKNPFPARLVANRLLNAEGSGKEVRHFEISLEGSGLSYQAGDALGVLPANCPALVSEILAALDCDGEEAVPTPDGGETSLRVALTDWYDITKPSAELLKAVSERSGGELRALLDPARKDDLKKWLWGREVIDVLLQMESKLGAGEFVGLLRKMQPRLYSISSSPNAHPGQVHLTVGAVRYESFGRSRKGVCSTFLADRCAESTRVPVFVQPSHGFKLPEDKSRPIIMVGPGTGIAPFRAFLEERRASGATGMNWLFFGDQRRASDFLYEEEMVAMQADGTLTRLDLAFSRDQAEKIYVQHRMLEAAAELWAWLEAGAHFYVCGDASRMAKDVDAALHQVIETAGGQSKEAAAEYVSALKQQKRYQRDVY